jgi:hypothetical protein
MSREDKFGFFSHKDTQRCTKYFKGNMQGLQLNKKFFGGIREMMSDE